MNKVILLWAILMTVLAAIFIWRYEQKACEVVNITNIVDTAIIYIPIGKGSVVDNNGFPGLQIPKFPGVIESGKQKRFVIMPQVTLGMNNKMGGVSLGLSAMYLRDRRTYSYTYDFGLKSHSIGIGFRF